MSGCPPYFWGWRFCRQAVKVSGIDRPSQSKRRLHMDADRFDTLVRSLRETQSRRGLTRLLGGLAIGAPLALLGLAETEAKRRKKKKKKKKASGGTPVCTPQCAGCGGSNGCGGTCGCGANQFCHTGICRTCDVTCNGDAIACGSALNQRLVGRRHHPCVSWPVPAATSTMGDSEADWRGPRG